MAALGGAQRGAGPLPWRHPPDGTVPCAAAHALDHGEEPFTYADSTQSAATIRRVRIPAGGALAGDCFRLRFQGTRHDYQRVLEFYYNTIGRDFTPAVPDDPRDLYDLSAWTGSDYYRRRADDHWAFTQQMLCRVDGQYNGFRGALAEQFYWCNWSCFGQDTRALEPDGFKGSWDPGPHHRQKGNMASYSTLWCINIILLGADILLSLRGET